ncbi:MAG: response regulator [Nitrospirae bacterium]|nr:response regulator [Nitrospirota bacterium]
MTETILTRILYMEDDPGLARLLQKILQRRGFVIDIATNGEEGLSMLDANHYELLLIDYNMPFLGGIDVIRALSAKNALPPTIMVTGEGNEMVAVEALKLGAADYIVKDTDMKYLDLLPTVIDQVLYRQQMLRDRQKMLGVLRESEERYRLLFDSNPIPSMAYDLQTLKFVAVNEAALAHYGYTYEEFLSLNVSDVYTPEEMPALLSILSKIDQGEKQRGVWKHRLKNGSLIDVEITSHNLMLGDVRAHLILANDITEQKLMKENMLRSQKLESLGVLAGGLAHDFNNLLTAIIGNISLAKLNTLPGESVSSFLDIAEQATSRAQSLTQQLLTFARGGSPVKKPLAVKTLIVDSAGFAIRGSKSRCEFKIAPDLRVIEADEGQLGQVINNLVMNADQSMPEGGTITVSGENVTLKTDNSLLLKPGDYIRISVADQGIGIPNDNLKKIFDPYFTTKDKGIGLGLATCYSIMKHHDGHVTVTSTPGAGSTFSLYLPASSVQTVPAAPDTGRAPLHGTGRILVMDDEDIVRDVLQRSLTHLGYEVVSALDGNEAVTLYEQALKNGKPFDAVIMDLTIPGGMGGKEAVIKLRRIDPGVKAIVSSGYSDDPIMSRFKDYGFSGVVSKPYTLKALSETVHAVIAGDKT